MCKERYVSTEFALGNKLRLQKAKEKVCFGNRYLNN